MIPPDVKINWDDNDLDSQAAILAWDQIRDLEEAEKSSTILKYMRM